MVTAFAVVGAVAVSFGGHRAYGRWLTAALRIRTFDTDLSPAALRNLFAAHVARTGWEIADDGNPMVAQSRPPGPRRQIALLVARDGPGATSVRLGPGRCEARWGVPLQGRVMRSRLRAFLGAVRRQDPAIAVVFEPDRP
jgi:hypothetical protein